MWKFWFLHISHFANFGQNIKTWQERVAYACVANDHKPPEGLDHTPLHWPADALPLRQCLPSG